MSSKPSQAPNRSIITPEQCAGFRVGDWCKLTSIGRSKLYELPDELQPASVKLGRRKIIRESPSDYLARIDALNRATQK